MKKQILFSQLKKDYDQYVSYRQKVIENSNKILKLAKQSIFSLHRNEIQPASRYLKRAEDLLIKLKKYFPKNISLEDEGTYKAAIEEYIEAKLFWQILTTGRISKIKNFKFNFDDYLAALCDLTGELLRKIVLLATNGENKKAIYLKEIIAGIMSELIKFDLTGYLRHKYDEAKRNLKRAEEIIYEINIRSH
jgi:predicted translin family RNA/ssDNA-binding protein